MNKLKKYLLPLTTMFPTAAFASGGDIIDWMGIELLVIIAFVTTLLLIKLNWTGKGLMILVFIATQYLVMKLTNDISYTRNRLTINIISIIAPVFTTVISYIILKSKFKREIN